MSTQSYEDYLLREITASKYALLLAYEKRDNLLYIEKPSLEADYYNKIGHYEERILANELEVSLLEKKKQLIQTAINRREDIDLESIDKQIDEERKKMLDGINDSSHGKISSLTAEQLEELETLYKKIVNDFHPGVHKDLTETQRYLYNSALEAYKNQSLDQMRLVYEMLYNEEETKLTMEVECEISTQQQDIKEVAREMATALVVDYSLASKLFPYFKKTEEDLVLQNARDNYTNEHKNVMSEIEAILSQFPFNAKETLQNPELTQKYLDGLKNRMAVSENKRTQLQNQINELIEHHVKLSD